MYSQPVSHHQFFQRRDRTCPITSRPLQTSRIDEGKDGVRVVRAEVAFDFEGELLPIGGCGNEKPVFAKAAPGLERPGVCP